MAGKRILARILSKVPKTKVSPRQIPLPFFVEKIVKIEIPQIAQTAMEFIKANRFPNYSMVW
ncbi:hypothetical protein ACP6PL_10000 [Dapis sp. BLCC M126]|uniref:hypothetical protein n=1 Tax=Dapis sp. BLCC M126 TaxID=3400189 RepID=UPI003CFB4C55